MGVLHHRPFLINSHPSALSQFTRSALPIPTRVTEPGTGLEWIRQSGNSVDSKNSSSSPEHVNRIGFERGIRSHDRQLFDHRLSDEHPIERIAMNVWQSVELADMTERDV